MSGNAPQLHIRHNGRSYDYTLEAAGLGGRSTDQEVLTAAARLLEVEQDDLKGLVVAHRPEGDIVVHPEAVYG